MNLKNLSFSISKFFLYLALASVLVVSRKMLFPFVSGKVIFFRVATEISLLFFLIGNLVSRIKLEFSGLTISVALFTLIFVLTGFTGINPGYSFFSNFERGTGAFQIIHYFIFFILLVFLFRVKSDWKNFIRFFLMVSLLISIYGLGQLTGFKFFLSRVGGMLGRISGTMGNPIYLAYFLTIVIFLGIWLFFQERNKWIRIFLLVYLVFQLVIFSLASTRSAALGLFFGLTFFLVLGLIEFRSYGLNNPRFYLTALALILLITIPVVFFLTCQSKFWKKVPILNRLVIRKVETENLSFIQKLSKAIPGLDKRLNTWSSALAGFIERPLFGWGAENFPYVFDKYYSANHFGKEIWYDRAHNLFLEYLIWGGILLLFSYLSVIFSAIRNIIKNSSFNSHLKNLGLSLILAYLVQGIFNFEDSSLYLVLFTFLAFLESQSIKKFKLERIFGNFCYPVSFILILIIPASLYFTGYLPYQKNILLSRAMKLASIRPDLSFLYFEKALNFYSPVGQQEAVKYYLSFTAQFLEKVKPESELAKKITQASNTIYQKNKKIVESTGIFSLYYLSLINFNTYKLTKDEQFLDLTDKLVVQARKKAPTRIILLNLEKEIAKIRNDSEREEQILNQLKFLRPDLVNE